MGALLFDDRARAERLIRTFERLASDRSGFEQLWREIVQRFLPGHPTEFSCRGFNYNTQGERRTEYVYDSRPVTAAKRCAAIFESQITPSGQMWIRFEADDRRLLGIQEIIAYFDEMAREVERRMTSAESGWVAANQQTILDLVLLGTGVNFTDQLDGEVGVRFRNIHLSEIVFAENHQGQINQAYRVFTLSARDAVEAARAKGWQLPEKIRATAEANPDEKFRFLHCVVPRDDRSKMRFDFKGMKFASYYIAMDGAQIVWEGGYETFPYAVARLGRASGEIYGRSPAMDALPSTKMLNEMKKADIKTTHRLADPVLLMFDDDELDGFDLAPGALNRGGVNEQGQPLVQALQTGDPRANRELGDSEVAAIAEAFYITLYQVLIQLRTEMTATQSEFREVEKAQMIAPVINLAQAEYGGGLSVRVVDVLARQDVFDAAPAALAGGNKKYRTVYDSPAARMLRASQAAGIMQSADYLANLSNVTGDPAYVDRLNPDEISKDLPIVLGAAGRYLRNDEQVAEVQATRAEAEQQKAMRDAAPGAAALAGSAAKMTTALAKAGEPDETGRGR